MFFAQYLEPCLKLYDKAPLLVFLVISIGTLCSFLNRIVSHSGNAVHWPACSCKAAGVDPNCSQGQQLDFRAGLLNNQGSEVLSPA